MLTNSTKNINTNPIINSSLHPHEKIKTVIRESRQGLPFTLSPEYMAAQRAYMRYHNMNPIFGISSKEARAADEAH